MLSTFVSAEIRFERKCILCHRFTQYLPIVNDGKKIVDMNDVLLRCNDGTKVVVCKKCYNNFEKDIFAILRNYLNSV